MQDGYIFSESIAKNIAVSKERIDRRRLGESYPIINIDDFVSGLPFSYNTVVGQER